VLRPFSGLAKLVAHLHSGLMSAVQVLAHLRGVLLPVPVPILFLLFHG
jgi:hypothetical protein